MKFHLIAVGQRVPDWIEKGYHEFAKRLPIEHRINLIEIATSKRHKNSDTRRLLEREAQQMIAAIPKSATVIALDVSGQQWSTQQLAQQFSAWQQEGHDIALLVGGPDGLTPDCVARARYVWSLSRLTFPHALVRIMIAEQLYRAWSINNEHPYHRS
jgi:23S rRNA (pseudouridine1915-N3)-methyltransferase